MAFGFVLMVLALYKATVLWKEDGKIEGIGLIKVLIQDQAIYFFVYVSCLLKTSVSLIK